MSRLNRFSILVLLISLAAFPFALTSGEGVPKVTHQDGVAYVTGGIGDAQQTKLKEMAGDFSLKITLATSDGHYLGGGQVEITGADGSVVLSAEARGPIFLADLQPGRYRVAVTPKEFADRTQESTVQIDQGQTVVNLTW